MKLSTFKYALRGIRTAVAAGGNMRIHIPAALLAVVAGVMAGLTATEWGVLILAIFLVLAMETMNTAVERLVDFISPGFHEQAGAIKDMAAGAVLLAAVAALFTGLFIFLPKLL